VDCWYEREKLQRSRLDAGPGAGHHPGASQWVRMHLVVALTIYIYILHLS